MDCPRCATAGVTGPSCPRCGIVFAKLRPPRARPAPLDPSAAAPPARSRLPLLAVPAAAFAAIAFLLLRAPREAPSPPPPPPAPALSSTREAEPPPPPPPPSAPPLAVERGEAAGWTESDVRALNALVVRLNARSRIEEADLRFAEEVLARHPEETAPREALEAALLLAASQERDRRRFAEALALARRAAALRPHSPQPRALLLALQLETNDWPAAEAEARQLVAVAPRDADAHYGLGYALFRQDRNREAAEALEASLGLQESERARTLLERLRKGERDEKGMTEQQLSHFHVRYDGEAHEDVGREILRSLERHYATLVRTFDHQPAASIPVILFSRDEFYKASGAPAWSGGVYDLLDGRVRIPIRGLTASLSPDLDATLIHEVTHAFVWDLSRGLAPRDLQEGLAQYMEGRRSATDFRPQQLQALAEGRWTGVGGFYAGALSFVEHLIASRGMGGINELLRAMAETGSADEAMRRVHGVDLAGARRAWSESLRNRYGS